MDAGLSMIMANIGRVEHNHFVFDPFVGSGEFYHPLYMLFISYMYI